MAPRVEPADVKAAIVGETYTVLPDGRTTVCQLTLYNGFTVEGSSACVSAENFNAELGNKYSRERAENKVWELLGFLLCERLHQNRMEEEATARPQPAAPGPALGDPVDYYERINGEIKRPLLALITGFDFATDPRCVGLVVFTPNGQPHPRAPVPLLGPHDPAPEHENTFARRRA